MSTSKVHGNCPDCGASHYSYRYEGISKVCSNCGRDNKMEEAVKVVESIKKNDPENKSPSGGLKGFSPQRLEQIEKYRLSRIAFKKAKSGK